MSFGTAGRGGFLALLAEAVVDLVSRDRPQASAKCVAGAVAAEAVDVQRDRFENFLNDVRQILLGQPLPRHRWQTSGL